MKLYVCWGTFQTFGPGHPCRNAADALHAAGYDPEIIRSYGWGPLPAARTAPKDDASRDAPRGSPGFRCFSPTTAN